MSNNLIINGDNNSITTMYNTKYIVLKYVYGLKPMTDFCDTEDAAIEAFDKLLETDGLTQLSIANINHDMRLYSNFDIEYPNGDTASFCLAEVILANSVDEEFTKVTLEQDEAYAIINEKKYNKFETDFYGSIYETLKAFAYKDHMIGDNLIDDVVSNLQAKFSAKNNYQFKEFKMIKIILP